MNLKFKALSDGSLQIEGVGIPFGGPVSGKDLHGQYFSNKTDFGWDLIPDGHRPLLYQHGLDDTVKTNVIGRWSVKKIDDKGVWVQAQLNARSEYLEEIKELLDKDSLGLSSATMGHLVKVSSKSGEILRWPVVEMSLTPNPANPAAYVVKAAGAITPARYVAKLLGVKHGDHDQADHGNRDGSAGGTNASNRGEGRNQERYPGQAAEASRSDNPNMERAMRDTDKAYSALEKAVGPERSDMSRSDHEMHLSKLSDIESAIRGERWGEVERLASSGYSEADDKGHDELADHYDTIVDRALRAQEGSGKSLRKSLAVKHGDHDQADHGNRGGGGSGSGESRDRSSSTASTHDDISAIARGAHGEIGKIREGSSNLSNLDRVRLDSVEKIAASIAERHGERYGSERIASGASVRDTHDAIDRAAYIVGRIQDEDVQAEMRGVVDDLRASVDKNSKSLKADEVVASAPSEPVEVIEEAVEPVEYEEDNLEGGLRELLSDVIAFYLEAHGAHWNVVGDDFKQFHELFGEIYEDVQGSIDPLAENIRKLNAVAPFSLKDIAADPALSNASGSVNPEDLCEELYASNSVVLMKILSCFNMATSAGEQGIANFLADRQDMHKKWAWQLSASLDERGEQTPEEEAAEPAEMEITVPKSRKHGDHDQSDHGNRDGGGGSSDASSSSYSASRESARPEMDAHVREIDSVIGEVRSNNDEYTKPAAAEADRAAVQINRARDAASPDEARRILSSARESLGKAIAVLENENNHTSAGRLDEVNRGIGKLIAKLGSGKSLNNATLTGRSAQPVARLAIKAGKTTERKSIDLTELKKQMRAMARDAALKNLGR